MARARPVPLEPETVEEFLAWEREQEDRYEYVGGVIRTMDGDTLDHDTTTLNIAAQLRALLAGGRWPVSRLADRVTLATGARRGIGKSDCPLAGGGGPGGRREPSARADAPGL